MDAGERALLAKTVLEAVERAAPGGVAAVDAALAEVGWVEMLAAERADAVAIVFGALGATGAAASVLDDVIVAALGIEFRPDLAVLLPPFATSAPSRSNGLGTGRAAQAEQFLVVADEGGALVARASVTVRPAAGLDPAAELHVIDVTADGGAPVSVAAGGWEAAVAQARVALAHQIGAACRTMLQLARAHALERVQFNRPIARFQAVRHRLADAFVAVEALEAVLDAAAMEPGALTGALAKAQAGRTAAIVGKHCQQVLAGIGFTTDHPFHTFLKRTMVLDGLFGQGDDVVAEIGRGLLETRRVPVLVEL